MNTLFKLEFIYKGDSGAAVSASSASPAVNGRWPQIHTMKRKQRCAIWNQTLVPTSDSAKRGDGQTSGASTKTETLSWLHESNIGNWKGNELLTSWFDVT